MGNKSITFFSKTSVKTLYSQNKILGDVANF